MINLLDAHDVSGAVTPLLDAELAAFVADVRARAALWVIADHGPHSGPSRFRGKQHFFFSDRAGAACAHSYGPGCSFLLVCSAVP